MSLAKSIKSVMPLHVETDVDFNAFDSITDVNVEYIPAGDYVISSIGLIKFKDTLSYVKEVQDLKVVTVGQSVRKVNKKKVKRLLKEKLEVLSLEYEEHNPGEKRSFTKEEKAALEYDIVVSLLPETELDEFENTVVLDQKNSQMYIFNTTVKASEKITAFLRHLLESLPVTHLEESNLDVSEAFAALVRGKITTKLSLGNYAKLEDADGIVVWSKESLYEAKVTDIISSGKYVTQLRLDYDGSVEFTVDLDMYLKGIKFSKEFHEEGSFEADLLLCVAEIRGLLSDLKEEIIKNNP